MLGEAMNGNGNIVYWSLVASLAAVLVLGGLLAISVYS